MSGISNLFGKGTKDEKVSGLFSKPSKIDTKSLVKEKKRHVIEIAEEVDEEEEKQLRKQEKKLKRRERKHKDAEDTSMEDKYMSKLVEEEDRETEEQEKKDRETEEEEKKDRETLEEKSPETVSEKNSEASDFISSQKPAMPAITMDFKAKELSKADRTIFVGNVPAEAMSSKKDTKRFKRVFSDFVKKSPEEEYQPIESMRFRSIHTDTNAPRRAAFITKAIEEGGVVNSYIVFKKEEDSMKALKLNGVIYENHHLRIDHLTHPMKHENKLSVFVGNLDFEETEESLWKYFEDKLGDKEDKEQKTVWNVRIVRDSKTNYGKGFGIVQFTDMNYVERALLLDGKKLTTSKKPRRLRIARCKSIKKVEERGERRKKRTRDHFDNILNDKQKSTVGRARKVLGKRDRREAGMPVLEGQRAHEGSRIEGITNKRRKVKKPRTKKRLN
ncbi:hypothetical protein FOA43_002359 [Brettanomyces nanus]|uniref:Nucleolar protein 12 n=1 Tax=Eeniella nana TaxID=13502 RepID=A0A875S5I5_EENNA|nr:uncharacterized protein FOA43_002359 [Brettanomyces nanus]QPG75019.1 hypothetical protein FOA43_002359 [Brettanomyces nanus]